MSIIDWSIKTEELSASDWKLFNGLSPEDALKAMNGAVAKMQYLSSHPHHAKMTIQQKEAFFNSYEKSRMDLLADIATSTPMMENSKLWFGDLIAGIDGNRILLDNISGIEDFKYTITLYDCRASDSADSRTKITVENDFAVAIPNDIIGQHAFYIILENIIRNTAKHSPKRIKDFYNFSIEVHEPAAGIREAHPMLNRYYEIHVFDDVEFNSFGKRELTESDYHFFEKGRLTFIKDEETGAEIPIREIVSMEELEKIVRRQNIFINQDLLDMRDNSLRQGAWGMIEMEAAAAYLRKVPVEKIDDDLFTLDVHDIYGTSYGISGDDHRTANILKGFIKNENGNRHLAYRFFMLKPKEVLLVLDDLTLERILATGTLKEGIAACKTEFAKHGIGLAYTGFKKDTGIDQFSRRDVYEHELLGNFTSSKFEESVGLVPNREVSVVPAEFPSEINKAELIKFKENLWIKYKQTLPPIYIENHWHQNGQTYLFEYDSGDLNAAFDHHASSWGENFESFPTEYNFLEVTTGLNQMSEILRKSASELTEGEAKKDEAIFAKLLSSIYDQVIVLDERIQEAAYSIHYHPEASVSTPNPIPIPFYRLYLATGVYVPSPATFNLSSISYEGREASKKVVEQLKDILRNTGDLLLENGQTLVFDRVKFLVIHLGVLEKVLNADGEKVGDPGRERVLIGDIVKNLLSIWPLELRKNIKPVIISGRGLPSNLPHDYAFVNYSALAQYLIDNRNKYLLNELLYSTRKIKVK